MARKQNRNNRQKVNKAVDENMAVPASQEIGQPRLQLSRSFVSQLKVKDLLIPNIWDTFDEMEQDSSVYHPLSLTQTLVGKALTGLTWDSSGTRKSKVLADYANYVMHNMSDMLWIDAVRNFNTDIKNGFSLSEIVTRVAEKGPYKGSTVLKRLGPRPCRSVYAWVWDKDQREVTHVVQRPLQTNHYVVRPNQKASYLGNIISTSVITGDTSTNKYPIISKHKLLHFKYNSVDSNPQGQSPLIACYDPWREKQIISQYQVIGVTRDFGGVPVARVPQELIVRANDPEGRYPEDKKQYEYFQNQLADMHAGRQAFFILSSEMNENSQSSYEYDLKLLGIDGGSGNKFDVDAIIKDKRTEIYNSFGAGFLILGQGGNTSSYNLSTTGTTSHNFIVEQAIEQKIAVLKYQLLPTLLDLNNIDYSYKDLPTPIPLDPYELSLDEGFKAIQRGKSVQGMPKGTLEYLLRKMRLPSEGIDELDFSGKGDSRSGESQSSSGTGSTQSGGASSDTNMENKQLDNGVIANLIPTEDKGVLIDADTERAVFTDEYYNNL